MGSSGAAERKAIAPVGDSGGTSERIQIAPTTTAATANSRVTRDRVFMVARLVSSGHRITDAFASKRMRKFNGSGFGNSVRTDLILRRAAGQASTARQSAQRERASSVRQTPKIPIRQSA